FLSSKRVTLRCGSTAMGTGAVGPPPLLDERADAPRGVSLLPHPPHNGHTAAEAPRRAVNSRRLIRSIDSSPLFSVSQSGPRFAVNRGRPSPNSLEKLLHHKDCLRDHAVDALGAVHDLSDMVVDSDARDHVGLLARQFWEALDDEEDGLAPSHLQCLLQARIETHDDPVRGGLGARPGDFHVFADDELKFALQAGLNGGQIDLAMALGGV